MPCTALLQSDTTLLCSTTLFCSNSVNLAPTSIRTQEGLRWRIAVHRIQQWPPADNRCAGFVDRPTITTSIWAPPMLASLKLGFRRSTKIQSIFSGSKNRDKSIIFMGGAPPQPMPPSSPNTHPFLHSSLATPRLPRPRPALHAPPSRTQ